MELVPFPPLPLELFIVIIEEAASSRSTAFTLMFVSRTVYRWTKPILYKTIHLTWWNISRFTRGFFLHNFSYTDPVLRTPPSLIRILLITRCSGSWVTQIVNRCDRIDRLLCNTDLIENTTTESRPKEIIIYSSPIASTIYGDSHVLPPVLEEVSHLYVEKALLDDKFLREVGSLKHLTHLGLSFNDGLSNQVILCGINQLLEMTWLQSILIRSMPTIARALWTELAEIKDDRLIVEFTGVSPLDIVPRASMWADTSNFRNWKRMFQTTNL